MGTLRVPARSIVRALLAVSAQLHELAREQLSALSASSVACDPALFPWAEIVEVTNDIASYAHTFAERGVLPDLRRMRGGLLSDPRFVAWSRENATRYPLVIAKVAVIEQLRNVLVDEETQARS